MSSLQQNLASLLKLYIFFWNYAIHCFGIWEIHTIGIQRDAKNFPISGRPDVKRIESCLRCVDEYPASSIEDTFFQPTKYHCIWVFSFLYLFTFHSSDIHRVYLYLWSFKIDFFLFLCLFVFSFGLIGRVVSVAYMICLMYAVYLYPT